MENRFQRILLISASVCLGLALTTSSALANNNVGLADGVPVKPSVERREILEDVLDNENFELGVQVGMISIEDFGSSTWQSGHLAYHMTEYFYLKARYAKAEAGLTSFEKLVTSAPLLTEEERELTYYGLNVGYNLFPGEIFVGRGSAFNSAISFEVGAGTTEFAGDDKFTVNLTTNFRIFFTDWLAWDLAMSDYVFDTQITGETKTTHNLNLTTGISVFF
ncbi:outer membrane beta-barrel domain-containing protein [Algibacillus agarilyticus]|uniref:outer membrane beta-barrel domain-containing protein n=1 Tax=Algibacillus agarilyticus TaxID=2234133 RepID=UPI000DD02AC9|nr:outer membrane beta-barrel domain-containing protein [Algibacillus agarilyticus]